MLSKTEEVEYKNKDKVDRFFLIYLGKIYSSRMIDQTDSSIIIAEIDSVDEDRSD